jgi:glycosyltransferase involved in cell wall biosynthesis
LRQLQACYPGSNGVVIYPGAETLNEPTVQDLVSWSRRKNKIVMLGRVVEAKNVHLGIQLVQELRVVSSDVELVIIGNGQGKYAKRIEELVATCSYVTWHRGLSRGQLEELVVDCKWGLHCAEYEHYGIAALELQRLGCITLVPNSCGQAEIALPDLRYVGIDDAIAKYTRLFSMPDEDLARMHEERTRMVHAHSVEQFYDSFEKLLP